jgi:hypothetical protein
MFSKKIKAWKEGQDDNRDNQVFKMLKSYWSKRRRHDIIVEILLETDFTNDELVELSNMLGQVAHDRERKING